MANHALGTPARAPSPAFPQAAITDLHAVSAALINDALAALEHRRDQQTLQQSIAALTSAQDLLWLAEIQQTADQPAPAENKANDTRAASVTINVMGDVGVMATGSALFNQGNTPPTQQDTDQPASLITSALRELEDGGNDAIIDSYNLRALAHNCLSALDTLPPPVLSALADALQAWRHQRAGLRMALHDVADEMLRAINRNSHQEGAQ